MSQNDPETGAKPRHFLDIDAVNEGELRAILSRSAELKSARQGLPKGTVDEGRPLDGHVLAMIFEKPSTRTRVSFEVGIRQLGGTALMLSGHDSQLGRGETVADTARVLSRYVDAIMIRTDDHNKLLELAEYATVPVINGLTDDSHPCQVMADVLTFEERHGPIKGQTVTWCGDGNNMAVSWIHAAARLDFDLRLACPEELNPPAHVMAWAKAEGASVTLTEDVDAAVDGSACVIADTWVSMGDDDALSRHNLLQPYQVNERLMSLANKDAVFMHCLPAHRNEEVTDAVMDGPQSVIWDEAENRLHAQKGVLAWCFNK
jgi:ornithine carbamoyltransferase